jgi:hypothetical protein
VLEATGEVLPVAVGLAISSLPLIVVVLTIVAGPRTGADLAFLLGWLTGSTRSHRPRHCVWVSCSARSTPRTCC